VDTHYPPFTAAHYRAHPGLAEQPYAQQLESLLGQAFGTADAYSRHMTELGHEAGDVIVNNPTLQSAWVRERPGPAGLRVATALTGWREPVGRAALRRIALAQIHELGPDVVYCQDMAFFTRRDLDRLRAAGHLVVGQIASALPPAPLVQGFELVLTSFPHFVERIRRLGVDAEYLAIAYYERVTGQLAARGVSTAPEAERPHPLGFVGGVDPGVHGEGVGLLESLVDELPLEVWGYGADRLPSSSPLRAAHRGEAWGLDMYEILARSGIVLNRHIAAAEGHANNMRLFEATGVGALVVTEAAPNLAELFEPGEEVVTYGSRDELVDRVRHYLEDRDARLRIAAAGQARTLSEHTYERRIAQLEPILTSHLR
jgi:spore maturation protein CgeB